jgi:hypothetical protein
VIGHALRNSITCHDFEKTAASSALAKAGSKYLEAVKQNAQSSAQRDEIIERHAAHNSTAK